MRRLHDIVTQHLRALAEMKKETIESFITSMVELKLDQATMFEWQRHSQDSKDVPRYILLEFLDLRVQASESVVHESDKRQSCPIEEKNTRRNRRTLLA